MHSVTHRQSRQTFSQRFWRNLKADLFRVYEIVGFAFMMIVGSVIWILGFAVMHTIIVRFILQPLFIYVVGTQFTHLPYLAVILMIFFPLRFIWPVLFIAVIIALTH